ncbi:hypothetical protein EON83_28290 [bacterium]|nr:MAG: hypothetical protein EON83_28290 [bacterium]
MTAPFGIEMHSPVEQLEIISDLGQGRYSVTPPKVHPSFVTYIVQATPGIGVFWVKAISPPMENDSYGAQARQLKDQIHGQLSKRYGSGVAQDGLMPGSIWDEPRDWTRALNANERHCFVMWEANKSDTLPTDLESLFLGVSGLSPDDTSLCIEYASVRMKDAEAELQDMLSDLL